MEKSIKDNIANKETLEKALSEALDRLYTEDVVLITSKTNEVCIVHRFALYMESFTKSLGNQYSCDIEYNRNFDGPKRIYPNGNGSRPDLIIHKRKTNEKNLLVLECKTYWSGDSMDADRNKIIEFCEKKGEFRFKYGVLLYIGKTRKEAKIFFVNE